MEMEDSTGDSHFSRTDTDTTSSVIPFTEEDVVVICSDKIISGSSEMSYHGMEVTYSPQMHPSPSEGYEDEIIATVNDQMTLVIEDSTKLSVVLETIPDTNDTKITDEGENSEANHLGPDPENLEPDSQEVFYGWDYQLCCKEALPCVAQCSVTEFKERCLRGCKWAPDGSCLLTNSEDKTLRLFNLPADLIGVTNWSDVNTKDEEWRSVLKVKEGGQVYDYCWYPLMSSMDSNSSCFLASAQDNPVHLWDAFTGELRATYLAYNYADVLVAAHSIAFDAYGEKIYCGYHKGIRIFDVHRPGRECIQRLHKASILSDMNLTGIASCIAVSPYGSTVYACGSFDKTIGIFMEDGTSVAILQGHQGGLTQLKFNRDGTKLFSGGRRDSRLICWDMRNLGREYEIFERVVNTSQRVYFDISPNEKYLVSGCTTGEVRVWDLQSGTSVSDDGTKPDYTFSASTDCVNGLSLNPYIPLMATASGQRHFPDLADDDQEEIFIEGNSKVNEEIGVRLFQFM